MIKYRDDRAIKIYNLYLNPRVFPLLEFEIYTSFRHPHLVNGYITTEGMRDDQIGISMPRAKCDLVKYLIHHEVSPLVVVKSISNAVLCLHRANILHLDIKPANILVYGSDDHGSTEFRHGTIEYRLTDYGIASYMSSGNKYISSCPMISYLWRPPENIHGSMTYTVKSDVWSLGIILLDLLDPVSHPSNSEYPAFLQTRTRPSTWKEFIQPYRQLLDGMLKWAPEDRMTMEHVVSIVGEVENAMSRIPKKVLLSSRSFTFDECVNTFHALTSLPSCFKTSQSLIRRAILEARLYVNDEDMAFVGYALSCIYEGDWYFIRDCSLFKVYYNKRCLEKGITTSEHATQYMTKLSIELVNQCRGLIHSGIPDLLSYYPEQIIAVANLE